MRRLSVLVAWTVLSCAWLVFAACGNDETDDGVAGCTPGDPVEGPTCDCSGDSCVCPSSGDCAIRCVSACELQCAGSGSCDFECGDGCKTSCTGSGNCAISVGHDSSVDCTSNGDCNVACSGDCTVKCSGSGTCTVKCANGADCNITSCSGSVEECPGDVLVCNGSCS